MRRKTNWKGRDRSRENWRNFKEDQKNLVTKELGKQKEDWKKIVK